MIINKFWYASKQDINDQFSNSGTAV